MEGSYLFNFRFFVSTKIFIFFILLLLLPKSFSHSHSFENPSFKYSREANEDFKNIGHVHDHNDGQNVRQHDHIHHGQIHKHTQDMGEVWLYSMLSTLFISTVPFLLLLIIPLDNSSEKRPLLKVLLAFASGGLLGDAFLHLIPHATNPHHSQGNSHGHTHENTHTAESAYDHIHDHCKDIVIGLWVLCGIIVFLTVEKLVRLLKGSESLGHGHDHNSSNKKYKEVKENSDKKHVHNKKQLEKSSKNIDRDVDISGYLNLAADFAHNFTDGLAIGASFLAGNNIGLVTTITILLHEVPHEIGDFAILIKSGCSRRKAMLLQLVTAVGALSGNALALVGVGQEDDTAPWVLPFTAGGFIYIATVSVLPELLEESTKLVQSIKEIAALLTGVVLMVFIANFE